MQTHYYTLPKADNTKSAIINCLANNWPLTTKQIHNRIVKENASNISYQAIHKTMNDLQESKIIEKLDKGYQLNKCWIEQNIKFFGRLNDVYLNIEKEALEDLWKKDYFSVNVNSLIEMARFLINNVFQYPNPLRKTFVSIERLSYPLIGFSEEELQTIENSVLKLPCYVLVASNTSSDKYFACIKEKFSKLFKAKTGIKITTNCDIMVCGDYVVEIYINDKLFSKWKKLYEETKDFDEFNLKKYSDLIYDGKGRITITIQKNPIVAAELRRKVTSYFDGENK